MTSSSALLLLLPLLLGVPKIPDDAVQKDVDAVVHAIEHVNEMQDPRKSLAPLERHLSEAQRALLKRHWELETLQTRKPEAPAQFELGLFAQALNAFVRMDAKAQRVTLRADALDAWTRGEEVPEPASGNRIGDPYYDVPQKKPEPDAILTQEAPVKATEAASEPEVKINERGEVNVKNAAGNGNRHMEVRKDMDADGNQEVIVTFVKNGTQNGGTEPEVGAKTEQNQSIDEPHTDVKPEQNQTVDEPTVMKMEQRQPVDEPTVMKTLVRKKNVSSGYSSSFEDEEDEDAEDSSPSDDDEAEGGNSVLLVSPEGHTVIVQTEEGEPQEATVSSRIPENTVTDEPAQQKRGGGWLFSNSPILSPFGSIFNSLFGRRKKRDTTVTKDTVQTSADGRTVIRTREQRVVGQQNGGGGWFNMNWLKMLLNRGNGKAYTVIPDTEPSVVKQENTVPSESESIKTESTVPESNRTMVNEVTVPGSESTKTENTVAKEGSTVSDKKADPKKAAIKEYLDRYMAETEGKQRDTKLAYVLYAEQLYWTAKWIETLENRVVGVPGELIQQFLFSSTGLAGYQELKTELDTCGARLDTLKAWLGEDYRKK